jgi:bidirectional [NiFe] hydrogenase diaphorase subunit
MRTKRSAVDSGRRDHRDEDHRWKAVDERIRRVGGRRDGLIEVLHAAQNAFGYLDSDALSYVSTSLGVPLSKVYGVATFYSFFSLSPRGEHTCLVCTGTACHINGADELTASIADELGINPGETTSDGKLSLFVVRCPGTCSLAPAVIVDDGIKGRVTPDAIVAELRAL